MQNGLSVHAKMGRIGLAFRPRAHIFVPYRTRLTNSQLRPCFDDEFDEKFVH